jgi:hypothetical protein
MLVAKLWLLRCCDMPPGTDARPSPQRRTEPAADAASAGEQGRPSTASIGAVSTMRSNQLPRIVAAFRAIAAPIEWPRM